MGITWQGYSRDETNTAKLTAGTFFAAASLSVTNNSSGVIFRVYQVTCWTLNFTVQGMNLSKGLNNSPTELICTTQSFNPGYVQNIVAAAVATAVGPPFVDLQYGESLIASCFGGIVGDTFGIYVLYELGTLY